MKTTLLTYFDHVYAPQQKLADATIITYGCILRRFCRYCGGDVPLEGLDKQKLSAWLASLKARGLSRRTVYNHERVVLIVSRHIFQEKRVKARPDRKIRWLRSAPAGTLRHFYVASHRGTVKTPRHFDMAIHKFAEFCGGDVVPMQVSDARLYKFHVWLLERGHGGKYAENVVQCVRSIARAAVPTLLSGRTPQTPPASGSLREFFETTYLSERNIKTSTVNQYRYALVGLENHVGHAVRADQLADRMVNEWVLSMETQGLAPRSVKGKLQSILTLWKAAWQWELTEVQPRRIRRVKVPYRMPDAWTLPEVGMLLLATTRPEFDKLFRVTRLHVGQFFEAFIRVTYDTAFRCGDVLGLQRADIRPNGTVAIVQAKTGRQIVRAVRRETMEAIARTLADAERDLLFPLSTSRRKVFYPWWQRLLTAAGFPTGRRNGPQKLRRSAATHAEHMQPGSGKLLLGHLTPGQAEASYFDPTMAYGQAVLPPAPILPKLLEGPKYVNGGAA